MINKSKLAIILVSMGLIVSGCQTTEEKEDIEKSNIEENIDQGEYTFSNTDKESISDIENLLNNQLNSIKTNDIDKYIETVDKRKLEYVAEKKSWFRDINLSQIHDLDIEVLGVAVIDENTILAELRQSYTHNDKKYDLKFINKYKKKDEVWLDSDLVFNTLETENFILKYPNGEKDIAQIVSEAAEEAYKLTTGRIGTEPRDKTTIKVYDNLELLRQSVKLSFAWQFEGWYEFPESIKMGITDKVRSSSANSLNRRYKNVVSHELTHKVTLTESNNNLPYWFSEGLASHFTGDYNKSLKDYSDIDKRWSIETLESKNLEVMTDKDDIKNYYRSSAIVTAFIVDQYGKDVLMEIVHNLGEYEYIEGTGAEVDSVSIERFHKVIKDVLGISIKDLDKKWIEYKESH